MRESVCHVFASSFSQNDLEAGRADIRDEVRGELLFGLRDSEREDLVLQARHLRERDKRQQGRSGT